MYRKLYFTIQPSIMHFKPCEVLLQLFNKLVIIFNSDNACNLQSFPSMQTNLQNKAVIFTTQYENGAMFVSHKFYIG